MTSFLAPLTLSLKTSWQKSAAALRGDDNVRELVEALCAGRFNFVHEVWHGPHGETASELLLRAWDAQGQHVNKSGALSAIAADGSFPGLNRFLVFAALAQTPADENKTLSLNILPSLAAIPDFWDELEVSLNGHRPENIIFEILEHETTYPVDGALMQAVRGKGYRFALDDFAAGPADWQRLADFAPHLSFIKIDGPLVRAGLDGHQAFGETIAQLQRDHAALQLIAEHVNNEAEAQRLHDMGIAAVQGKSLPASAAIPLMRPRPFEERPR